MYWTSLTFELGLILPTYIWPQLPQQENPPTFPTTANLVYPVNYLLKDQIFNCAKAQGSQWKDSQRLWIRLWQQSTSNFNRITPIYSSWGLDPVFNTALIAILSFILNTSWRHKKKRDVLKPEFWLGVVQFLSRKIIAQSNNLLKKLLGKFGCVCRMMMMS